MEEQIPVADFPGNRITIDEARAMLNGGLREELLGILMGACAPIYWLPAAVENATITHSGTVTFVRTDERSLGITALHVLTQYFEDHDATPQTLRIANAVVGDLRVRLIDQDERLDIATFAIDDQLISEMEREVVPAGWPPRAPAEGCGVHLAGFPAIATREGEKTADFGLCTILGVARTVTDIQITWLHDPAVCTVPSKAEPMPDIVNLGGMSGGPLIAWFGSPAGVLTSHLCGIVTEAPRLGDPNTLVEKVAAVRADFISDSGRIVRRP